MIQQVPLDDGMLSVDDRGAGPPLLLVHGFPLDHTMWAAQLDEFANDFRVIAPDLRGFGTSSSIEGFEYGMEQFAADLSLMLRRMEIAEPVVFCGLSMGGYIAFQFWKHHLDQLKALILCDTKAAADAEEVAKGRRYMASRVVTEGAGSIAEGMLTRLFAARRVSDRSKVVQETEQIMRNTAPETIAAAQRGMAARPDMTSELPKIAVPTLLVVGEEDAITTVSEMESVATAIPGARFERIEHAGHMAPLEEPVSVNAAIRSFLP